jgi:Na+-transporting NADH:ubiquinone oxidoreductase subunit F
LTPSEKHWLKDLPAGLRLACQVKVEKDISLELPDSVFSTSQFQTVVTSIRDLTYDIKEVCLHLQNNEAVSFRPGQYIQMKVPGRAEVEEPLYRSFSIASDCVDRQNITLFIRHIPNGVCTTYIHERLRAGDTITLVAPLGDFYLRDSDRDILFVAGGSGMAPIRSILLGMIRRQIRRPALYFYGAKAQRDLYFVDDMRAIEGQLPGFRFVPALSAPLPEDAWNGERGLITEVVDRHVLPGHPLDAYLCGSPMMVNACVKVLKAKGLPDERIFFDRFV